MGALFDTTRRLVRDSNNGTTYTGLTTARTDVSIVCWYRPIQIGALDRSIISIRDLRVSSPTERFSIVDEDFAVQSRFGVNYDDASGGVLTNTSPAMDTNDTWYLIIAVYGSNGTAMTYTSVKNFEWKAGSGGIPTESTPTTFAARAQTTALPNLVIGSGAVSSQTAGANGYIAEVSVWNKAITPAEALSLTTQAASSLASYTASCANYWPLLDSLLDSKGGLTLYDYNAGGASEVTFDSGIHPALAPAAVKKAKLLLVSSAAGATIVKGEAFAMPSGSAITGTKYGTYFSGQTITVGTGADTGYAVLKVNLSDIGSPALSVGDSLKVYAESSANYSSIWTATVIEE